MTTVCRLYAFSKITFVPGVDPLACAAWPYTGADMLHVDQNAARNTLPQFMPPGSETIYLQVEAGKRVHVEIIPPGKDTVATILSPVVDGERWFIAGPGWTVSLLEEVPVTLLSVNELPIQYHRPENYVTIGRGADNGNDAQEDQRG